MFAGLSLIEMDSSARGPTSTEPPTKEMELMETENSSPVSDLSAAEKACCNSSIGRDLSKSTTVMVKPSIEFVGQCISRLSLLFPLTSEQQSNAQAMFEVYANLLNGYTESEVRNAFAVCAKKLTRMPLPADLIEEIEIATPFRGAI